MEQGTKQQTPGQQSKSPRMHLQQGLLEIYCGDGKGKTTAALGLALRAAGCGLRVHIVQFLKGTETGELASLAQIPQISLVRCDKNWGFTFSMTEQDKKEITVCHNQMLHTEKTARLKNMFLSTRFQQRKLPAQIAGLFRSASAAVLSWLLQLW